MKKAFLFVSMISLSFVTVLNYATSKKRKSSFKQVVSAFASKCEELGRKYGPLDDLVVAELTTERLKRVSIDDIEAQKNLLKSSDIQKK